MKFFYYINVPMCFVIVGTVKTLSTFKLMTILQNSKTEKSIC